MSETGKMTNKVQKIKAKILNKIIRKEQSTSTRLMTGRGLEDT